MITINTLYETNDVDRSSANTVFHASMDVQEVTSTYVSAATTVDDLLATVVAVLGKTSTYVSDDGILSRTPPLCHPQYPWLYASEIMSLKGFGQYAQASFTDDSDDQIFPLYPTYAFWTNYEWQIKFTGRPYPVLPDTSIISTGGGNWFTESGDAQQFDYVTEWSRYCEWNTEAQNESITAQVGQMKFLTQSGDAPGAGTHFDGLLKMFLPNGILKMRLYQIPLRWITSDRSYITKWIGRINQNPFPPEGDTLYGPGALLYISYRILRTYSPPVPSATLCPPFTVVAGEKLVDVEFVFLYTTRRTSDAPAAGAAGNGNFIVGGHNSLPWQVDRNFYYAESQPVPALGIDQTPAWLSFPMELLFMDPDTSNPAINP